MYWISLIEIGNSVKSILSFFLQDLSYFAFEISLTTMYFLFYGVFIQYFSASFFLPILFIATLFNFLKNKKSLIQHKVNTLIIFIVLTQFILTFYHN